MWMIHFTCICDLCSDWYVDKMLPFEFSFMVIYDLTAYQAGSMLRINRLLISIYGFVYDILYVYF